MAHPRRRPKQLIPQERRIYHAELETCPHCGTPLRLSRHYRWRKTVQTLNGVVYVASRPKECPNPGCPQYGKRYPSAAAHQVALPYSTYGLDVVAQIGWQRDHEHLSDTEIHRRLQGRVQISRREVDWLIQQYRLLLACDRQGALDRLTQAVAEYGGSSSPWTDWSLRGLKSSFGWSGRCSRKPSCWWPGCPASRRRR
jgi:hypothetical protein